MTGRTLLREITTSRAVVVVAVEGVALVTRSSPVWRAATAAKLLMKTAASRIAETASSEEALVVVG